MTSWLDSLPHQIPFRAASSAQRIDAKTIEGTFLCSGGDALVQHLPLATMLVEAMAQLGGGLAFGESSRPGFLSAIDDARIESIPHVGVKLVLRVRLDAEFGGMFRFSGTAEHEGLEIATARFYLASAAASPKPPVS